MLVTISAKKLQFCTYVSNYKNKAQNYNKVVSRKLRIKLISSERKMKSIGLWAIQVRNFVNRAKA